MYKRQVSGSVTIAPSESVLGRTSPGDELLLVIDVTPLDALAAQFGAAAAQSPESFFELSSGAAQAAGYTVSATAAITVDGQPGLAADLAAPGGAGRLSVILSPNSAVRVLGQATPAAWSSQAATYAAILAGWAATRLAALVPANTTRRATLAVAALLLLATAARNTYVAFHRNDADTRARLAWLLATIPPEATVMGGWTPGIAFRRPALFHFVLHEEIQAAIPPETWQALARDIASGTLAPAAIDLDPAMSRLPTEVLDAIHARYVPGGLGTLLVKRGE